MAVIAIGFLLLGGMALLYARAGQGAWSSPVVSGDVAADLLLARFVERSRRFRETGGLLGLGVMAVRFALDRGTSVGFPGVLIYALVGSLVGSIAAEAFRFRRVATLHRATLEPRHLDTYRDTRGDRRLALVAVPSIVALGLAIPQHRWRVLVLGAIVALLAALRWWAGRRIVERARPVLPPSLAAADDRIRRAAIADGVGRPVAALSAFAVGAQWGSLLHVNHALDVVAVLASIAFLAAGTAWWWTTRHVGCEP